MDAKDVQSATFMRIINEGRDRKKLEERANLILGKARLQSNIVHTRKAGDDNSLASRVGIAKRSIPTRSATSSPIHNSRNGGRPARINSRLISEQRLDRRTGALDATVNGLSTNGVVKLESSQDSFSIRGSAGPQWTTIVAQNFARGTTALDIESVMVNISPQVKCKLVASNPTVIAEIAFPNPESAHQAVAKFNNKVADGHTLYVYLKENSSEVPASQRAVPPSGPRADRRSDRDNEDIMIDVETDRQRYDDERRDTARRVDAGYQGDRSAHPNANGRRPLRARGPRIDNRLYSDDLVGSARPHGRLGR